MYLPKFNQQTEVAALQQLVIDHPLAMWVVATDDDVLINHIPFLMEPPEYAPARADSDSNSICNPKGTLKAHIAKANPLFKILESGQFIRKSTVVFRGEQTYITPAWYPGKAEHAKVVPTWNYMVMHAAGLPVLHTERQWLHDHVSALTHAMESKTQQSQPEHEKWQVTDAPDDFIEMNIKAIAGVEIPIESLTGKWKLGQNRSKVDQASLCEHYSNAGLQAMQSSLRNREEQ